MKIKAIYRLDLVKTLLNHFIPPQNKMGPNAGDLNEQERGQIVGVG